MNCQKVSIRQELCFGSRPKAETWRVVNFSKCPLFTWTILDKISESMCQLPKMGSSLQISMRGSRFTHATKKLWTTFRELGRAPALADSRGSGGVVLAVMLVVVLARVVVLVSVCGSVGSQKACGQGRFQSEVVRIHQDLEVRRSTLRVNTYGHPLQGCWIL